MKIDPVGCGCTECLTGEYRPALNEEEYENYKMQEEALYCSECNCYCGCHPCEHEIINPKQQTPEEINNN